MKKTLLALVIVAALGVSQVAYATPVTVDYEDTQKNWATWTPTTNASLDVVGSPEFLTTSVTMDDSQLLAIKFNALYLNNFVTSGDLFIDANADQDWDYVVSALGTALNGTTTLNLYEIMVGLDEGNAYTMSYYGSAPEDYRAGHPVGLNFVPVGPSIGSVSYTAVNGSFIEFDFGANSPLHFNNDFIIGYTVTCANDVIYQQVPVPEPGTFAMLGAGLLGLGLFARRKKQL